MVLQGGWGEFVDGCSEAADRLCVQDASAVVFKESFTAGRFKQVGKIRVVS